MLQRLLIALAQMKAWNTSENLLNEMRQIVDSLYRAKEINKTQYRYNRYKMNTIFMNSENSKTSDPYYLIFQIRQNQIWSNKYIASSRYNFCYTWKNIKKVK